MSIPFVKTKTLFGTNYLKSQGYNVNSTIESINDLEIGEDYLIADMGLGELNGGYEYQGKIGDNYIFKDIMNYPGVEGQDQIFTEEELLDSIENGEIAISEMSENKINKNTMIKLQPNKNYKEKLVFESIEEVVNYKNEINEAKKKSKKEDKKEKKEDKKWIQSAFEDIPKSHRGKCTGKKYGSSTCPPGSKQYNMAKNLRKIAKSKKTNK